MNGKTMVVVLAATGVLGGGVFAQGRGDHRARRAPGQGGLAEYLGLTAEQRERLSTLRTEHQKVTEPLRSEGRELHEKLRSALDAKDPDPTAVGHAMLAVRQHGEKMRASADDFRKRMKGELTAEQQQKFDAFEAARRVGRAAHGRRGPRPAYLGGAPGSPFGGPDDGPPAFEDELDGPPSR